MKTKFKTGDEVHPMCYIKGLMASDTYIVEDVMELEGMEIISIKNSWYRAINFCKKVITIEFSPNEIRSLDLLLDMLSDTASLQKEASKLRHKIIKNL